MIALWLLACTPEPKPVDSGAPPTTTATGATPTGTPPGTTTGTPAGTTPTGTTPTGTTSTPAEAACTLAADNPLRVACTVTLPASAPATLELTADGAPTRTFTSADATEHALTAWGLRADTTYTWSVAGVTGEVTTGPLPATFDTVELHAEGTLPTDAVLVMVGCGPPYLALIDGDGEVVWVQEAEAWETRVHGYRWSPQDRRVIEIGSDRLREYALDGTPGLALDRGVDFLPELHHDVARHGTLTYAMYRVVLDGSFLDGLLVFDGDTLVADWFMPDTFPVPDGAGSDWSHGNGVSLTDDGSEVMLSFRNLSVVLALDADPASADFLGVRWIAMGEEPGLPEPDFVPASADARFVAQHAPVLVGDELWVYDNLSGPVSRGLVVRLDAATGQLQHVREWPDDVICPIQGGALPLGDGVLMTCSDLGVVQAFDAAGGAPVWRLDGTCDGRPLTSFSRGQPVSFE